MSLRIEKINPIASPTYQEWVTQHGDVFADPKWIAIQKNTSSTYVILDDSNWLGCFTLNQEKKWGVHLLRNPHFSPHIGWVWQHSAIKTTSQNNTWKLAMELLVQFLLQHKISKIQFSFPTTVIDLQTFVWSGFTVTPKYTYQIELGPPSNFLDQLSSSHRNHWNKAKKDNIQWQINHDPSEMERLVKLTMKRKKQKFHSEYLHQILHQFCEPSNSIMSFAYSNGAAIAGATVIFNHKKAYLLLSGYDEEKKHGGAGIGCVLQLMESCQKRQIPIFDFEGSMIFEVEKYFRGFGGNIMPYLSVSKFIFSKK